MSNSFIFYAGQIIVELFRDIIYFPVWWYSRGLVKFILGVRNFLINQQKALALLVWIKNIFKPMYAQYDWQGMLISFFVRLGQIIFRSLVMLVWFSLAFLAICFWVLLPVLVIYEITIQLLI